MGVGGGGGRGYIGFLINCNIHIVDVFCTEKFLKIKKIKKIKTSGFGGINIFKSTVWYHFISDTYARIKQLVNCSKYAHYLLMIVGCSVCWLLLLFFVLFFCFFCFFPPLLCCFCFGVVVCCCCCFNLWKRGQ